MFHMQQSIPAFRTVAPGIVATTTLPVGPTYRELALVYKTDGAKATKAKIISDIERITLLVNGIARVSISGKNLMMLNDYYGYPFNAGELIIPLSRHYLRTPQGEEQLVWGTRNVSNLGVEVKLATGAVSPELKIEADWSYITQDMGTIIEIREFNYDFSGSGDKEISDLPKTQGALMALHLNSDKITNLEVKLDELRPIERDTDLTVYHNRLKRVAGRVPQTGVAHVDALRLNRIADVWGVAGVKDYRIKPTLSAASAVQIVAETVNVPLAPSTR